MIITFGFLPRTLYVDSEKEYLTIIAALQAFAQRPSAIVVSDSNMSLDEARIVAESLVDTLQED